jgi:hypothetical protein
VSPKILATPLPSPLIGPSVVAPAPVRYPREWTAEPFDPPRIAARCRLKARAARWQTERTRRLDAGEDITEGDAEIRNTARESATFLWMINPVKWRDRPTPASVEVVAGCYEALADAVEVMGLADQVGREQQPAMKLLAEAQSSVRAAVEDFASTRRDEDQETVFGWLRRETDLRRVYVEYMQLDNPAPPDSYAELRQRIASLRRTLDEARGRDQTIEKSLQKVKYHANKIAQRPPGERVPMANAAAAQDGQTGDVDFDRVAGAVEALLAGGVPPSDLRLRDALLPVIDRFPAADEESAVPTALARVLSAVQDYVDQREADAERRGAEDGDGEGAGAAEAEEVDPLIAAARRRCGGRDAVLIGGVPSEPHRRRLERGLGLRSLNWLRVEHHESFDAAESAIRRPGVGMVLVMTRWRSHRDGPAARAVCKELNIPLVELPAGYNLRQVAYRAVEQVPEEEASVTAADAAI